MEQPSVSLIVLTSIQQQSIKVKFNRGLIDDQYFQLQGDTQAITDLRLRILHPSLPLLSEDFEEATDGFSTATSLNMSHEKIFDSPIFISQLKVNGEAAIFTWDGIDWVFLDSGTDLNIDLNTEILGLRVDPGMAGVQEIKFNGALATSIQPYLNILTPNKGTFLSAGVVNSYFLIGYREDTSLDIKVNGTSASAFGQFFWVGLNKIGLVPGQFNDVIVIGQDDLGNEISRAQTIYPYEATSLLSFDQAYPWTTTNASFPLTGQLAPGNDFLLIIGNDIVTVDAVGYFSLYPDLVYGENPLPVQVFHIPTGTQLLHHNRVITRYAEQMTILLDRVLPAFTSTPSLEVSGMILTPQELSGFTLNGAAIPWDEDNRFSTSVVLGEGINNLNFSASTALETATLTHDITLDSQSPELTIINPVENSFFRDYIDVHVSIADANPYQVQINGRTYPVSNGAVQVSLQLPDEGLQYLTIQGFDMAGNTSEPQSVGIYMDKTAPLSFDIIKDIEGWSNDNTPTIEFDTDDSLSGISHYEVMVAGHGDWVTANSPYTFPELLDGEWELSVKAVDNVGNERIITDVFQIDTSSPVVPVNLRVIPGDTTTTLTWAETDSDVVEYRIFRIPDFDGSPFVSTEELSHIDQASQGNAYVYQLQAFDRAGNSSELSQQVFGLNGFEIEPVTQESEATLAEYDGVKLAISNDAMPEDIQGITITTIDHPYLEEVADYPILSPIYRFGVIEEDDTGEVVAKTHSQFTEDMLVTLDYDESIVPKGFPETNLDVYYYDQLLGRWIRIEKKTIDIEQNKILFLTNHFTDFSVQPTMFEDLNPTAMNDLGQSASGTNISHGPISVSTQGGSVNSSVTDLFLKGRNGLDFAIERVYSSSYAELDSPSLALGMTLGINFTDLTIAGFLDDLAGEVREILTAKFINKLHEVFASSGDYGLVMGNGWRLNLPSVLHTSTSNYVKLPYTGAMNVLEMGPAVITYEWFHQNEMLDYDDGSGGDYEFIQPIKDFIDDLGLILNIPRKVVFENHNGSDFTFEMYQALDVFAQSENGVFRFGPGGAKELLDAAGGAIADHLISGANLGTSFLDQISPSISGYTTFFSRLIDPSGKQYLFGDRGQILMIVHPNGVDTIKFQYMEDTPNKLLSHVIDSMGRRINFEYDKVFQTIDIFDPDTYGNIESLVDILARPRIKNIYIQDDTYNRSIDYHYGFDDKFDGVAFRTMDNLESVDIIGDSNGEQKTLSYDYDYARHETFAGGGSAKINLGAAVLDFLGLGTVSSMLGIYTLELSGNVHWKLLRLLESSSGDRIPTTEIQYERKDYEFSKLEPADYFFFVPTALKGSFSYYERMLPKSIKTINRSPIFDSDGAVIDYELKNQVTNYDFTSKQVEFENFLQQVNDPFYIDKAVVDNGRLISTYRYEPYVHKVNRYFDWVDEFLGDNSVVTENRSYYKISTFSDSVSVKEKASGEIVSVVDYDWKHNGYKDWPGDTYNILLSSRIRGIDQFLGPDGRSSENWTKSRMVYDDWGNVTSRSVESHVAGHRTKSLTETQYHGGGGDLSFDGLGNYSQADLIYGIHNKPAKTQTTYWLPEDDGSLSSETEVMRGAFYYTSMGEIRYALSQAEDGSWAETKYTYDPDHRYVKSIRDPENGVTEIGLSYHKSDNYYTASLTKKDVSDALGNLSDITSHSRFDYYLSRPTHSQDPKGYISAASYDYLGRNILKLSPGEEDPSLPMAWDYTPINAPSVEIEYDDQELLTRAKRTGYSYYFAENWTDQRGQTVQSVQRGRVYDVGPDQSVTPGAITERFTRSTYNKYGQRRTVTDHLGNTITYHYDERGRLEQIDSPETLGEVASIGYQYLEEENARIITDAMGYDTKQYFTATGQPWKIVGDWQGQEDQSITYFNGIGQPSIIIDARSEMTEIAYNSYGLPEQITLPAIDVYDPVPHTEGTIPTVPQTQSVRPSQNFEYDLLGRRTKVLANSGTSVRESQTVYDTLGRPIIARVGTGVDQRSMYTFYDERSQKIKTVDPYEIKKGTNNGPVLEYNSKGLVVSQTSIDGLVTTMNYDKWGNLTSVRDPREVDSRYHGKYTSEMVYDEWNRLVKTTLPSWYDPDQSRIINSLSMTVEYDALGRPYKQNSPDGTSSYIYFNDRGQAVASAQVDATGLATDIGYVVFDPRGQVRHQANFAQEYNVGLYDDLATDLGSFFANNLSGYGTNTIQGIEDLSYVSTQTYDYAGRPTESLSAEGKIFITQYDPAGNADVMINFVNDGAEESRTTVSYNALGLPTMVEDGAGDQYHSFYNGFGENTASWTPILDRPAPEDHVSLNYYNQFGELTTAVNTEGKHYGFQYREDGLLQSSTNPRGVVSDMVYDARKLLETSTLTLGAQSQSTEYQYDLLGQAVWMRENNLGGESVITELNTFGKSNSSFAGFHDYYYDDPMGNIHSYTEWIDGQAYRQQWNYDDLGRMSESFLPNQGTSTSYAYDNFSRIEQITGLVSNINYDGRGVAELIEAVNGTRREKIVNGDGELTALILTAPEEEIAHYSYHYDDSGNMTSLEDLGKFHLSTYEYDLKGQLELAREQGTFAVDSQDFSKPVLWTHDDVLGQNYMVAGESPEWKGLDTRSNSVGVDLGVVREITSLQIFAGIDTHRLDPTNLMILVSDTNEQEGFTEIRDYAYEDDGEGLINIVFKPTIQGRYLKVHSHWDERDGYYQPLNYATVTGQPQQLINVFFNTDEKNESFTFDEMGNRLTSTVELEGIARSKDYIYRPYTNLLVSNGVFNYDYDEVGNLTSKTEIASGAIWSYEYDLANRMIQATTPETQVSYVYNAMSLRVKKTKASTNESWIYQYGLEGEVNYEEHKVDGNRESLTLKYFVLGKAYAEERITDTETQKYFYHHDHLGSVIALTDQVGELVWKGDYSVYGEIESQQGSVEFSGQYTSKSLDPDTGLHYFNARWYDSDLGRFITEDPIGDGQNWYAYVGNNPLVNTDPTGLWKQGDDGVYRREDDDPEWRSDKKGWHYNNDTNRRYGTKSEYIPDLEINVRVHAPKGLNRQEYEDWVKMMLSRDVYSGGEDGEPFPHRLPFGWETKEFDEDTSSGFFSRRYENTQTGEQVVSFRGTKLGDILGDWFTNFAQGLGFFTDQHKMAITVAQRYASLYKDDLSFTGHSLGGGLATIASAATGKRATTFNAAGIHVNNLRLAAKGRPYTGNIRRYVVNGEVLNSVQDSLFFVPQSQGTRRNLKGHDSGVFNILVAPILVNSILNHLVWPWHNDKGFE
jgi:RHS repeat-associated protein